MDSWKHTLIIGLDGATWDLMRPWAEQGRLPVIASLMERGAFGVLRSTFPPMTFPAWSTFMTGLTPAKHGLIDFTERVPGRYAVRFVNARSRRGATLWKIIGDAGMPVGVIGVPGTYPPEPVNGFMISGFDAPVATGINDSFVHPPGLYEEIKREVGENRITGFQEVNIGPGWHDTAFRMLLSCLERKVEIARHLMRKEPWRSMMVLLGEADTASHHFWMFHDPASPRHDPKGAMRHGRVLRRIYEALDRAVGSLIEEAPPGTGVVLCSDHGFGGTTDKVFYINRWLERSGLLRFREAGVAGRGAGIVKGAAMRLMPARAQEWAFRLRGGRLAGELESKARFGAIDWNRTKAYSEEINYMPGVWINLRGREPCGRVDPGSECESVSEAVAVGLHELKDPYTGAPVVKRVWRREELFHGPCAWKVPDLLLELALDRGYSYGCLATDPASKGPVIRRLRRDEHMGAKGKGMNGSHRPEGIFLLAGPPVTGSGQIGDADIHDLAPTILYLMGLDIPDIMDGCVIEGAIDKRVLSKRPPRRVPGRYDESDENRAENVDYTPAEEREIRERLVSLGYLSR